MNIPEDNYRKMTGTVLKILLLFMIAFGVFWVKPSVGAQEEEGFDLVVLVDKSTSVSAYDRFNLGKQMAQLIVEVVQVVGPPNNSNRIAVVPFSAIPDTNEIGFVPISEFDFEAVDFTQSGGTDFPNALQATINLFDDTGNQEEEAGVDPHRKRYVILITDGEPDISGVTQESDAQSNINDYLIPTVFLQFRGQLKELHDEVALIDDIAVFLIGTEKYQGFWRRIDPEVKVLEEPEDLFPAFRRLGHMFGWAMPSELTIHPGDTSFTVSDDEFLVFFAQAIENPLVSDIEINGLESPPDGEIRFEDQSLMYFLHRLRPGNVNISSTGVTGIALISKVLPPPPSPVPTYTPFPTYTPGPTLPPTATATKVPTAVSTEVPIPTTVPIATLTAAEREESLSIRSLKVAPRWWFPQLSSHDPTINIEVDAAEEVEVFELIVNYEPNDEEPEPLPILHLDYLDPEEGVNQPFQPLSCQGFLPCRHSIDVLLSGQDTGHDNYPLGDRKNLKFAVVPNGFFLLLIIVIGSVLILSVLLVPMVITRLKRVRRPEKLGQAFDAFNEIYENREDYPEFNDLEREKRLDQAMAAWERAEQENEDKILSEIALHKDSPDELIGVQANVFKSLLEDEAYGSVEQFIEMFSYHRNPDSKAGAALGLALLVKRKKLDSTLSLFKKQIDPLVFEWAEVIEEKFDDED